MIPGLCQQSEGLLQINLQQPVFYIYWGGNFQILQICSIKSGRFELFLLKKFDNWKKRCYVTNEFFYMQQANMELPYENRMPQVRSTLRS